MTAPPMRLRFAPSPTGYLHVGGARTAIFNFLHARRHGGQMLLRVEDTDVERSKWHHAEQIVSSLEWLGVQWDEGPIYQSDRLDRYSERAHELVRGGRAYRCFCTIEELEAERRNAESAGKQYRYSGRCRVREDVVGISHLPFVIRFRVPPGAISFHDLIRGDISFEGDLIDDFVLLRSDGNPTYHLSVVVDDVDMGITIVARGDDHLSNTPKHILLFRAFDAPVPEFAHVPLILGSDRKRLSKRTGATSVEEYQQQGILPEALFNFLLLLGWSPGSDRELITPEEAMPIFDLRDVNKSAAIFDVEKLYWLNAQYLSRLGLPELLARLLPFLPAEVPASGPELERVVELHRPRARTLRELAEQVLPYFSAATTLEYEEEAVKKHLKGDDLGERLSDLRTMLASTNPFDIPTTEESLRKLAESRGISAGKYIHPLRVALTGKLSSPPIFDVIVALGREETLARIDQLMRKNTSPPARRYATSFSEWPTVLPFPSRWPPVSPAQ
jgi:glutamyl-tRNA synthetase